MPAQVMTDRSRSSLPSIGVIVPNYVRTEETLEALSSVARQSYEGPVRVYLVYDRRIGVEALLAHLDPSVTALEYTPCPGENPIAAKRNLALDASVEDLVAFLDDDDLWHPDKLRLQVEALRAAPEALGCCTGFVTFGDRVAWRGIPRGIRPAQIVTQGQVLRASRIATSSVLLQGVVARRIQFDMRPEWIAAEDFDLWLTVRQQGPLVFVDVPLTALRVASTSASRTDRALQRARGLDVLAHRASSGQMDFALRWAAVEWVVSTAVAGRNGANDRAASLLENALNGRLFGRADRLMSAFIRAAWRSKRFLPAIQSARGRLQARSR